MSATGSEGRRPARPNFYFSNDSDDEEYVFIGVSLQAILELLGFVLAILYSPGTATACSLAVVLS